RDLRVEEQFVESLLVRGPGGGPPPQDALADLVAPQGVENLVPGDAVDPPRRVVGHAANAPRLQGVQEGRLHHVLDEVEVSPAEEAGQDGHQAARLMAEEMLHERGDRFRYAHGVALWTAQAAPSAKPSASIPKPRLKRARKFSHAIAAVSSTSCCGLKCSRRLSNSSSGTSAGVRVSATA